MKFKLNTSGCKGLVIFGLYLFVVMNSVFAWSGVFKTTSYRDFFVAPFTPVLASVVPQGYRCVVTDVSSESPVKKYLESMFKPHRNIVFYSGTSDVTESFLKLLPDVEFFLKKKAILALLGNYAGLKKPERLILIRKLNRINKVIQGRQLLHSKTASDFINEDYYQFVTQELDFYFQTLDSANNYSTLNIRANYRRHMGSVKEWRDYMSSQVPKMIVRELTLFAENLRGCEIGETILTHRFQVSAY